MPRELKMKGSQSTKVTWSWEPLRADLDQTAESRRV
jgi:hypothetical protein